MTETPEKKETAATLVEYAVVLLILVVVFVVAMERLRTAGSRAADRSINASRGEDGMITCDKLSGLDCY